MHSDAFDVIPYEDIKGEWKRLGAGSFGNVYKGSYLGIDVAIKEVLPSSEYDVSKYFEREWRLMKESRHPNIVLFLGLSRAPHPDNRIFIVSEYIENGNLRLYIHDKTKPLPWRLRLSFATDIARALAYLHARKCIHRDLKGENLLVTSNGRLKITDFGFARIAARSADESKRLTFCGTDSYMSPEILLGEEFDLPTDIFSLGIIFCELASRKLADDNHFKRVAPTFAIDEAEVHQRASPDCPANFITLTLQCLSLDPSKRPTTRQIIEELRAIEAEVLSRPSEADDVNVGSIKFMTGQKRPAPAPRIPSFGMGVGKDIRSVVSTPEDSDDELLEAVAGLSSVVVGGSHWSADSASSEPLVNHEQEPSNHTEYSTTVIRGHSQHSANSQPPSLSSIMTIKASPAVEEASGPILPPNNTTNPRSTVRQANQTPQGPLDESNSAFSIASADTYHTAPAESVISSAAATGGGSSLFGNFTSPLVHRFTLMKPGAKPKSAGALADGWRHLDLFFSSALLVSKCDVCSKRLGWKPVLECDDCGFRAHVRCGEIAPRDCGVRRPNAAASSASIADAVKSKNASPTR